MEEEWRDIKGYEGYYQVSNFGNVKSLERVVCDGSIRASRIVKNRLDDKGYYHVNLRKDLINKTAKVHQLVARAFIQNPEDKKWIDHINTIRTDNHIDNLRWVTPKENYHNKLSKAKMEYQNNMFVFSGKINKNARSVIEYDLHGNYIREWACVRYIMESTNLKSNRGIYSCAYGDKKHLRDKVYRWKGGNDIPRKIETGLSEREIELITERWSDKTPICTDGSIF